MPFQRFVESGRVAKICRGPYRGRLCSIVDVIDQTRVLVDGPETGVPRQAVSLNDIRLTKFSYKFWHLGSTKELRTIWKKEEIVKKWKDTQWAKNSLAKKKRRSLGDFDRFKLRAARRIRNHIRGEVYQRLYRDDKKKRTKLRKENVNKKGYNRLPKKSKADKDKGVKERKELLLKGEQERREKNLKIKRKAKK